jgi:archaellum component FlaC
MGALQQVISATLNAGVINEANSYTDSQVNNISTVINTNINNQIDAINEDISSLGNDIAAFSSNNSLTLVEANSLQASLVQVSAESGNIIDAATLLGITSQKTAYSNALTALNTALASFLNQSSYPISISNLQRDGITTAFQNVQTTKTALTTAISNQLNSNAQNSINTVSQNVTALQNYINNEFASIDQTFTGINNDIASFSSDSFITRAEAQSLRISLVEAVTQADDILSTASAVGITTEATAYKDSLTALVNSFSCWLEAITFSSSITWADKLQVCDTHLDDNSYPVAILPADRDNIRACFADNQFKETTLRNAIINKLNSNSNNSITNYINSEIAAIDSNMNQIGAQIAQFSSSGAITLAEANSLKTALTQVVAEAAPLMTEANANGITTEKDDFNNKLIDLQNVINVWIDKASYPIDITNAQRDAIQTAFANLQTAKTTLVAAINSAQVTSLVDGINTVKADLIDAFKQADIPLDDTWRTKVCNAKVAYRSTTKLGLDTQEEGKVGAVWVQGQLVVDDETGTDSIVVHNTDPIINLDSQTNSLVTIPIVTNQEYFIYLANHLSPEFNIGGRDARGKLFLSLTPDTNGYMSGTTPGLNARIVGVISTDGGGLFRRELDISWIAKQSSFPETYRDYCDYKLSFIDENTIKLDLVDGEYGQIYIAGQMLPFGDDLTVTRDMYRVNWGNDGPQKDLTVIAPSTLYYIYVSNNADQ